MSYIFYSGTFALALLLAMVLMLEIGRRSAVNATRSIRKPRAAGSAAWKAPSSV